jgi:hypothetical protein
MRGFPSHCKCGARCRNVVVTFFLFCKINMYMERKEKGGTEKKKKKKDLNLLLLKGREESS